MKWRELLETRGPLVKQMTDIVELTGKEDRDMTPEERETFDQLDADQEAIHQRVIDAKKLEQITALNPDPATVPVSRTEGRGAETAIDYDAVLRSWLLAPSGNADEKQVAEAQRAGLTPYTKNLNFRFREHPLGMPRSVAEAEKRLEESTRERVERRAQATTPGTAGGFTVPDEMMRAIEVAQLMFTPMRRTSTIMRTATGANLPIPTTNDTGNKGEIIAENAPANAQDVVFGQLVLEAYKYSSKVVLVSYELLQDSSVNLPVLLGRLLGERLGRIHADHFAIGTGSGQPRGIVTGATDSSLTAAAAGALTWEEVLNLKHTVDPAYRGPGFAFMGNDTTLKLMKQIKDTQNRPIWMPNLIDGEPDRFDGTPYEINQSMASGANAKALLAGMLSKYIIRDVLDLTLVRLDELYAINGQVAFLMWSRNDGDLLDAGTNPVKYLTMGAT